MERKEKLVNIKKNMAGIVKDVKGNVANTQKCSVLNSNITVNSYTDKEIDTFISSE